MTIHQDFHDGLGEFPEAKNPRTHPEWWGKTFFKHFPSRGFVGDLFTVNGTANPVLRVERRKYRFRFLNASVARIYDFQLMGSTKGPKAARDLGYKGDELQGQYRIPDGQQCMRFAQIATEGGLLPTPIPRDNFELWPAKRVEVIIDFTKYQDGHPTTTGDVVYLTNTMKMTDGRMWKSSKRFSPDPNYKIPVLKFEIGDLPPAEEPDLSVIPEGIIRETPASSFELEGPAEQPVGVRAAARQRWWRGRVADQRPGVRSRRRGAQHEEPRREVARGATSDGQFRRLGTPQREWWLGAPDAHAPGRAPHHHAQRQTGDRSDVGPSRWSRQGGRDQSRPGRIGDHLPRIP